MSEERAIESQLVEPRVARVLVVDDEALLARAVCKRLEKSGFKASTTGTVGEARAFLKEQTPDLILLDMRLPDGSGLELLSELRERDSEAAVVVLTAYSEVEDAVAAMKLNAVDYLKKPIDLDELLLTVEKALDKVRLTRRLEYSREREGRSAESIQLLGDSEAMQQVRQRIEQIAGIVSAPDVIPPTVLILGETGTGKDLAARLLHNRSRRRDRPFVYVDCGTLPGELVESELFGHEKGAFTQAHVSKPGLIEAAEDGTVFLDEIGELGLDLQTKLLALLGRRTVRRVGSNRERPVDAWIIVATNRDLKSMVGSGRFRADLYYRLSEIDLSLPPLRDRRADVMLLARHFAEETARRFHLACPAFEPGAEEALRAYNWPGNVRELRHLVERAVLLSEGGAVRRSALAIDQRGDVESERQTPLGELSLDEAEALLITKALERANGNVSEAARQLGVSRMTLRYRMQKHGL